ncbi:transporter substrate-binding domain-containing protein [Iodobacter fluviatilis]|uniref:Amino acid ABC transporter substrate-binding protein (PAAT family) n=1 Tax=Iodobacter fluviatilis TaxID=537 RepID=A0A377QAG7_9NEIS|nr:transporter substrate-binding domain-containing protein [Iodobacter fluviatilis]TCU81257.1 amino acid ABC transporter substrate-binding protein (PAAT family) [Iodobacter fluviatilis]STQ91705.1 Sulfate starvation-induced protein 7 [Iodobacter fluviatilis]
MLRIFIASLLSALSLMAHADLVDTIKTRGVLVVGILPDNPPFARRNDNQTFSGYDIDYASLIAKKMGVKLKVQDLDPGERITSLKSGKVDILVAAFTKTPEREREVSCSLGYFVAAQKALTRKGRFTSSESLANARLGASKGTTGETVSRKLYPKASMTTFADIPDATRALEQGTIDAVMNDEPTLAAALNKMPNKAQYEISNYSNTTEILAVATKLGEKRLMGLINESLVESEQSGEAVQIFNRWFGPQTNTPFPRTFRIQN